MLSQLQKIYGDRVVNICEGTPLEVAGRMLGFGGYLVRGVICKELADQYHASLDRDLQDYALQQGVRAIHLKGSKLWYNTIQCTTGSCTCKYN